MRQGLICLLIAGACSTALLVAQGTEKKSEKIDLSQYVGRLMPTYLMEKTSVDFSDVPLQLALNTMKNEHGVELNYNRSTITPDMRVNLQMDNVYVLEALLGILKNTGMTLQITKVGNLALVADDNSSGGGSSHTSGKGVLEGKVIDAATGGSLSGANIVIQGTSLGTASDINGEYRITQVPPGNYSIKVTYIGYMSKEIEAFVKANETTSMDIELQFEVIEGQTVTISAQAEGQASAINRQLTSKSITNIVSEERIQEFPDVNAAESIGRLPGVSIQRSGGEANKIVIRGLSDKYAKITIDGVQIPATDADARGVDLSMISQSSLAGIELYKAITPDMEADATAGLVNLVTKKAPDNMEFSFDAKGAYNQLNNYYKQYDFRARFSNRYLNHKLGIQASVSTEDKDRNSEVYQQIWFLQKEQYEIRSLDVQYTTEDRKRTGASLIMDMDLKRGGNIKFNNFYSRTDRDRVEYRRNYPTSDVVDYTIQDQETQTYTLNNALSGEHFWTKFGSKITWGISHAFSKGQTPYDHSMLFRENPGLEIKSEDDFKGPGERLIPLALNNFRSATLERGTFRNEENAERDITLDLNLEQPFFFGKNLSGSIKFGGKYRSKNRTRDAYQDQARYWVVRPYEYQLNSDSSTSRIDFSETPFDSLVMVGGINISMVNFLDENPKSREIFNKYALNPLINQSLVREWYTVHGDAVEVTGKIREYNTDYSALRDVYDIQENVWAAYLMSTFNWGQCLTFLGGVRIESEDNTYESKFIPEVSGFLTQIAHVSDTTTTYSKVFILPNFHLRFKPLAWWDLRLAATKTLTRPDYSMRLANFVVQRESVEIAAVPNRIYRGNPDLKTTQAWNYEANTSLYHWKYGLFSMGAFYKKIDDLFYQLNDVQVLNQAFANELGLPSEYYYVGFSLNEPRNTSNTKAWGYEFDLQARLDFMPGLLKNIVFSGNFTHLESETYFPRFEIVQDKSVFPPKQTPVFYTTKEKLQGMPENYGNIAVGYDLGGFSGRLIVYFQQDYLTGISFSELRDESQKGFSKWDLALKQKVNKNIDLFFNLNNISDFYEGTYQVYQHKDNGSTRFGMVADFGFRYSF